MAVLEWASKIAASALPMLKRTFGPWLGSMRSQSADQIPDEYIAAGSNHHYLPDQITGLGTFKRRQGQAVKFDTLSASHAVIGLLPAAWGAKWRWGDEFISDAVTDGIPTVCGLATKEINASSTVTDDGKFSNFWWRDQVNSLNRTIGDEYSSTTYPAPGTVQQYRVTPLWYQSGDGGITRGVSEFARRFFVSGSRRFLKVAGQWHFPSLLGTPARWNGVRASTGLTTIAPSGDIDVSLGQDELNGATSFTDLTTSGDSHYLRLQDDQSRTVKYNLSGTINEATTYSVTFRAEKESAGNPNAGAIFTVTLVTSAGHLYTTSTNMSTLTSSFANYTITVTCDNTSGVSGQTANSLQIGLSPGGAAHGYFLSVDYVSIVTGTSTAMADYLFPIGPFPPTHCGTVVKGTATAGTAVLYMSPDADRTDGGWTDFAGGTNLFAQLDDAVVDDGDYITAQYNGGTGSVEMTTPTIAPTSATYTVTIHVRLKKASIFTDVKVVTDVLAGGVAKTNNTAGTGAVTTAFAEYTYTLTGTEVDNITTASPTWSDVQLQFDPIGTSGQIYISQAYLTLTPIGLVTEGGWKGHDRFLWGVAYRYQDGATWAVTTPRFPNTVLANGLALATIDSTNPDTSYDKITYSNLPVPPAGVPELEIWRSTKIDSTVDDNLQLNPKDLRYVGKVAAGVTSFDDYGSDDLSIVEDPAHEILRPDWAMAPRGRYIAGGDMRVAHAYTGLGPGCITIAPVGHVSDYDLNVADSSSTAYSLAVGNMYLRITKDTSSVMNLELVKSDGTTATTVTLAFATYTTLQKLVDAINATSVAVNGQQWRAQILPGVDTEAATSYLVPHNRQIASCVVSGQTITKASGGLSVVAVGTLISGTGVTLGAYVTSIDSDTQLTFSGTITAATKTLTFYVELGDGETTPATTGIGYQRVIANSLPGFLYFTTTYLNLFPIEKDAAWMTVAGPGTIKSAANNFVLPPDNRFRPPLDAGNLQGLAAVDQGFVIGYHKRIGAIRNDRDSGTGKDADYRLHVIDHGKGCIAWNTLVPGNRFVLMLTPEGLIAADLRDVRLLSGAIYGHPLSDATTGTGDFSFEIPLADAATARDIDYDSASTTITAAANVRVLRTAIRVNYRASGSRVNRQVVYDFSISSEAAGLSALFRRNGAPWGWSLPFSSANTDDWAFSAMLEGRRSDGVHLYGFNDANGGTGDGRIDEFETGNTDNGSIAITGGPKTPWLRAPDGSWISAQEIYIEHNSPAGSTGSLIWHRGLADTASEGTTMFTMTPTTSANTLITELKMLKQAGRANVDAGYIEWTQLTGTAREIRKMVLHYKQPRRYRT